MISDAEPLLNTFVLYSKCRNYAQLSILKSKILPTVHIGAIVFAHSTVSSALKGIV